MEAVAELLMPIAALIMQILTEAVWGSRVIQAVAAVQEEV